MYTFAKICCLCLNNKNSLLNYKDCDLDNISAYDKLKHILPELVSETNTKLPPWLCIKCKEELDNTYIFYKKCQKSLYLLQSYNEKLQSFDDDSNSPPPPSQDPYSLKIKISTNDTSFLNIVPDKEENSDAIKDDLFQEDTFLFDEIIAKITSFGNENNLDYLPIKEEIPNVDKTSSDVQNEKTLNADADAVKEELFEEDTFLFDEIIAGKSSLDKKDNHEINPQVNSIKEETSDADKNTLDITDTSKNISDLDKNISDLDKNISNLDKNISDSDKNISNSDKNISDVDKNVSEEIKEEHNLFDEDTLPFDGNSTNSNISIIKNEINNDVFKKNEEIRHFDIFSSKSALESVQRDSSTSIQNQNINQVILEEKTINNQTEKVIIESNPSSHRKRRRVRPVYYNEESEDDGRNRNNDSDFEPDLNIYNTMSDDNLSDNSERDFSNESAKRSKTNNSVLNSNSRQSKNSLSTVGNNTSGSEFCADYLKENHDKIKHIHQNLQPKTRELDKSTTNFNEENSRNLQSKTPEPAVIIHHLPNTSSNTDNFNSNSLGNILPHLPQTENSTTNKAIIVIQRNSQQESSIPVNIVDSSNLKNSEMEINTLPLVTATNNAESNVNKPTKNMKTFRRKYVCNICRNKFKSSDELKEHMVSHEIKKYKCNICSKLYVNSNELELHMKEHNTQTPSFNYTLEYRENAEFQNSGQFTILQHPPVLRINTNPTLHISEVIEINSEGENADDDDDYYMEKFFCNICNKQFKDFPKHMVIHQNENKAICVYCNKTFPIKNQLFQHLRDVHCANDPICQICKETFQNIDLLFLHMYSHYGTEVHKCPKCEKLFLHVNLMYRHLESDHECTEFKCYKCGETFESCKLITYHTYHHESKCATLCYYCGKGFKSKRRLQMHINNLHAPPDQYTCKDCGKKCPSGKRLRAHIDSKHENNTYQCDVCSKFVKTKIALYVHRSNHSEQKKQFVCKECGKSFRLKFLLKNHERVHTGERPFECKTCGKKFTQEVSLVVHNRIHTGEKPYTCKDCGKSYTQSYVYKMHLKKHHGNEDENKEKSKKK